ncbi:MAG: AI-2E family transporter [Betaproteobacteria bacterium]
MNSPDRTGSTFCMDQAGKPHDTASDDASHALVYVGIAVTAVVLLVLLWYAIDVFLLLFIGVFLAVLLRAPADWLAARTGWSDGVTLGLVILALAALLATAAFFFGRAVVTQSVELTQKLPELVDKARERLRESGEHGKRLVEAAETPSPETDMKVVGRGLRLVATTVSAIGSLVVVVFLAIFLAWQPRAYAEGLVRLVPRRRRERARAVLEASGRMLKRWLVGQLVLMAIVMTLTGIALTALGVPFALPLALLAGLLEFVPYIGPIVAAIPGVLVAFAEGPQLALWVLAAYVLIQSIESYLLTPVIQHRAVYLPPALILFSQVILGVTAGPLGVIVATPLAAAALVAVQMLYVEDVLGDRANAPKPE